MVQLNAEFTFTDYEVRDSDILLHFVCYYPGAGEANDYYVGVSDSELAAITTQTQLRTLIEAKLKRKIRALNIADKLNGFIGKGVII